MLKSKNSRIVFSIILSVSVLGIGLSVPALAIEIPAVTIDNQGRVGIGTMTPERSLHVKGDVIRLDRNSPAPALMLTFWDTSYDTLWKTFTIGMDATGVNDGHFYIADRGLTTGGSGAMKRLVIDNTGNVGIGTATPQALLHIKTTTNEPSLFFDLDYGTSGLKDIGYGGNFQIGTWDGTTWSEKVRIDNNGNVGIGTTSPQSKLDVAGDIKLSGVLVGQSSLGGNAAEIQGFATSGAPAKFAFKYDSANKGDTPNAIQIWNTARGVFKTFIIDHPIHDDKYLIHATVEGPESAVYYRGQGILEDGTAFITLPEYFEKLTLKDDRTIQLTAKGKVPFILSYEDITDGAFMVYGSVDEGEFSWEVKAIRSDSDMLDVEVDKDGIVVFGDGPYKYYMHKQP